jgi:hypothetical protein
VWAYFKVTQYGCRVFETSPNKPLRPTSRAQKPAKTNRRSRAARG